MAGEAAVRRGRGAAGRHSPAGGGDVGPVRRHRFGREGLGAAEVQDAGERLRGQAKSARKRAARRLPRSGFSRRSARVSTRTRPGGCGRGGGRPRRRRGPPGCRAGVGDPRRHPGRGDDPRRRRGGAGQAVRQVVEGEGVERDEAAGEGVHRLAQDQPRAERRQVDLDAGGAAGAVDGDGAGVEAEAKLAILSPGPGGRSKAMRKSPTG